MLHWRQVYTCRVPSCQVLDSQQLYETEVTEEVQDTFMKQTDSEVPDFGV